MNPKQCDIVLLAVPFSDQTTQKVRPAVVVSNDFLNTTSEDIILVPLTSILKDDPYSVFIEQKDLSSGELLKPSRARADKIFTMHKSRIYMNIGIVREEILRAISQEIAKAVKK